MYKVFIKVKYVPKNCWARKIFPALLAPAMQANSSCNWDDTKQKEDYRTMQKVSRKILSVVLAFGLILSGGVPLTASAQSGTAAGGEITAFELLPNGTLKQEVFLGTSLEDLDLPRALIATVRVENAVNAEELQQSGDAENLALDASLAEESGSAEAQNDEEPEYTEVSIWVPVQEWLPNGGYSAETLGTYTLTPVLGNSWNLAEGVELPTVTVQVIMGIMPLASTSNIIDLSDSDADLTAGGAASGGKYSYDETTKIVTIYSGPVTVTGSTMNRQVYINGTVDVTLDNVNIDVSAIPQAATFLLEPGADVSVTLVGNNSLKSGERRAGLQASEGTKLFIDAEDENQRLESIGNIFSAGIGGGEEENGGYIHIAGGDIVASGYSSSIGGGSSGWGTDFKADVVISGGRITAIGAYPWAVGINGLRSGGSVVISGGTIYSMRNSPDDDRGICVPGGNIIITGGNICTSGMKGNAINGEGNPVHLGILANQLGVTSVSVDEKPYWIDSNHAGDNDIYLYITAEDHIVDVDIAGTVKSYKATWTGSGFTWDSGTPQPPAQSTGVLLGLSPNPATYGSTTPITITATVADSSLGTRALNIVDFYMDGSAQPFASAPVLGGAATTTLDISGFSLGDYQIKAVYGGSFGGAASDDTKTLKIAEHVTPKSGGSSGDSVISTLTNGNINAYGVNIPYTLNNNTHVLSIDLTTANLNEIIKAAGENKTIAINVGTRAGLKELTVSFPPAWFAQHTDISFPVQSSIGGFTLSNNLAKQFPTQNAAATVSVEHGSLIFSAKQSGKAVSWSDSNALVGIYMPYTPPKDIDTNAIVLYNKTSGDVVAHSFYSGGNVYAMVSANGTYDAKISAGGFSDTQSHWAESDILFASSHGLISGTSTADFSPNAAITRADFVLALGRLSGADVSGYKTSSFSDVASNNPAMPYIEWAVANKILQGTGNGKFGPNQIITREQMAVVMGAYATATGQTLPKLYTAVTFADNGKISAYAKDAVKAMQQAGIIQSKGNNLFAPQSSVTRAEAAATLRRFAVNVTGGEKGWVQTEKGQMYIDSNYLPRKGWLTTTQDNKYYFDQNGLRVEGKWLQIDGRWYYFYNDGKMARSTTVGDYEIDENGVRK